MNGSLAMGFGRDEARIYSVGMHIHVETLGVFVVSME
jgi:hypothetical protein